MVYKNIYQWNHVIIKNIRKGKCPVSYRRTTRLPRIFISSFFLPISFGNSFLALHGASGVGVAPPPSTSFPALFFSFAAVAFLSLCFRFITYYFRFDTLAQGASWLLELNAVSPFEF